MYFNKLHKAAQARGKALRKQHREDLLAQARQAAKEHDYREHHRLINLLAPKAVYRKFQLRLDGKLLTPEQELQAMRQHFEKLYNAADAVARCKEVSLPEPIPVDSVEVHDALRALPAGKAGLPGACQVRCGVSALIRSPRSLLRTFGPAGAGGPPRCRTIGPSPVLPSYRSQASRVHLRGTIVQLDS